MLAFCALPFVLGIDAVSFWTSLDNFSRSLLILTSSFWIFIQASFILNLFSFFSNSFGMRTSTTPTRISTQHISTENQLQEILKLTNFREKQIRFVMPITSVRGSEIG
jgi:hypothetical protein